MVELPGEFGAANLAHLLRKISQIQVFRRFFPLESRSGFQIAYDAIVRVAAAKCILRTRVYRFRRCGSGGFRLRLLGLSR